MTLQERELLARFLEQLATAQATHKDAEAERLINEACARQPDAAYLLVQRAMQLEQLLQASQTEVQKLQSELQQARSGSQTSFLNDPNAWGSGRRMTSPGSAPIPGTQGSSAPIPGTQGPTAQAPMTAAAAAPARGGWGSGLFGNIATTAAGVVAGSFLFQGLQGLMHRGDHSAFASSDHTGYGAGDPSAFGLTSPSDMGTRDDRLLAQSDQPELLNTYDTPDDLSSVDSFAADTDDSGDYA